MNEVKTEFCKTACMPADQVQVPEELLGLMDQLAACVHDAWAAGRIQEGWKYGAARNDATKEHPCLIAYEDLPASEKVYDKETALSTIRMILSLGYEITKKEG